MSSLLLFFVISVAAMVSSELSPADQEKILSFQKDCMQETGATEKMIMDAFVGTFTDDPVFANQIVCVSQKEGVLDADGHFNKDEFKKKMIMVISDEAKLDSATEKCLVEKGTIQETALEFTKCLYQTFHS